MGSAARFSDTHPAEIGWVLFCLDSHPLMKAWAGSHRNPGIPGSSKSVTEESNHEYRTATETPSVPRINDVAPNFTAETTQGKINFHEWIGDGWAILFSHPKDFTPVCTTELGYMAGLQPEFAKRNCKIIGLSVDPVTSHGKWAADIEETQGHKVNYPMIGDPELKIAKLYDMLPAESGTPPKAAPPRTTPRCAPCSSWDRTRRSS